MDQRAADASVAVGEWVDGFELGVCEPGLHDGRMAACIEVAGQVVEQHRYPFRRRWNEIGVQRVVV